MDIAVTWNPATGTGDWSMTNGDLTSGRDLETAILVSLFTDARVDDYVAPAPSGAQDRRGCWTDTYTGYQIGSRLWTRTRLVKNQTTLNLVQGDVKDALDWLLTAGVVASFDIDAAWVNKTVIAISIVAHMPSGNPQTFRYSWVWGQVK